MTLILDRVCEREHPAVAVPQQVDPPEAQGLPDALGFLDGSLDREERRPSRPFALADPELIVEDDPIAEGGEVRETREVSVRHPRAPVEAEDRAAIRRAERFPGQTVAEDGDLPLRRRHRVSHGLGDAHRFVGTILFHANKDDSLDRESKDRADATERLELLAGLVVTTHEDDGPTGRLGRAHELLDPGVAHDGIAHEEGLDRAGIGRLLHLRRTVGHRAVCGDRLEEFFDELRLVSDAAFAEHLGADARPEGLLDPLHPRMRGAVDVDLRRQGRIAGFQVLDEGLPREAGPDEDQRLPDLRGPQLDEDVVEEGGPRVSGGEHLAVPRRPDRRQLTDSILPQLGDQGLLVVEGQERHEGLLRGRDGLVDSPELVGFPRLDDRQDVLDADVQGVMSAEVLGTFDDDPGDPESVREGLELDVLDADRERDADFLATFRAKLVRLHVLPPVRRGADEIAGLEEIVEMPQVVGVLHADLDLSRFRVAVEDAHRVRAMEGDRISAYRGRPCRVNMLSIRATAFPSLGRMDDDRSRGTFGHPVEKILYGYYYIN